jgi:hypothetical protein
MANAGFTAYRNLVWTAGPDINAGTIKAMFVDHADDTPVVATDDFINDIASAARVPALASCPTLGTKTFTNGVFDAADTVFSALTGDQSESMILLRDTGTESTSNLLLYWDTASGLPITPNGANVTVVWSSSGIATF